MQDCNNTCIMEKSKGLSAITIKYNRNVKYSDMDSVTSSNDAAKILRDAWSDKMDHVEEFLVLCLNRANKVLGLSKISSGGTSGCIADPKVIFQIALKSNASNIIVSHNHPSGNTKPSNSDIKLTEKLKAAGEHLDIPLLDHIILTSEGFFSFVDEELI